MRKWTRLIIGLMACAMLGYSVYMMATFGTEAVQSERLNDTLAARVVTPRPTRPVEPESETAGPTEPPIQAPIQVDFDLLREESADIMGWLYCEDTPINLPLAQATDNDYYLRRLLDGTPNNSGTLFADFRCPKDFSGRNTIVYGHNMRSGAMFGTLKKYESQAYFDEHPQMWLLTPQGDYKVELLAGYVTAATSDAYLLPETDEETLALAKTALEHSTFSSGLTPTKNDRYLTLSTCSYEFDEARYVLLGRIVGNCG